MKEVLIVLAFCKQIFPNEDVLQPRIHSLHVQSNIRYRYAHTLVRSRVNNPANISQEVTFNLILPETAFISRFIMEVDGSAYNAYVKETEEAIREYKEAVRSGRMAGHIALSARDSNRFTVSVNLEPHKNVAFNLTYEELLSRTLGAYKHVINLDPGQIVPDLRVEVRIEDSGSITTLNAPALRVSNEIDADPKPGVSNPLVQIERPNLHFVVVKFAPTPKQQRELSRDGIKGQLIVQYDLGRSSQHPSQLLVNDGYFVHYFSPEHLRALSKHVTFVLDSSMKEQKLEHLKEAMNIILRDLRPVDYFSIVCFGTTVQVWNYSKPAHWEQASVEDFHWKYLVVPVTSDNVQRAKMAIQSLGQLQGTNIHEALEISIHIVMKGKEMVAETSQLDRKGNPINLEPIIILLTNGVPTEGDTNLDNIIRDTTIRNRVSKASIFSLALKEDAKLDFLKTLSLRNSGFTQKIYEASDTPLQLRDFYRQVASPLLTNIIFSYESKQVEVTSLTKHHFDTFYSGSELMVAGHLGSDTPGQKLSYVVMGQTPDGLIHFEPEEPMVLTDQHKPGFVERLWAYLTIQQLLDEDKNSNKKEFADKRQQAIELALKYSFVTPVTSLVVVQPDGKNIRAVTERADKCLSCTDLAKLPQGGLPGGNSTNTSEGYERHNCEYSSASVITLAFTLVYLPCTFVTNIISNIPWRLLKIEESLYH